MANELKITEGRISFQRVALVLRSHEVVVGQTLSPTGTIATSAEFGDQAQYITVYSDVACYVRIWDAAGTLTAANGEYLPLGITRDYEVSPGQVLSCIVI